MNRNNGAWVRCCQSIVFSSLAIVAVSVEAEDEPDVAVRFRLPIAVDTSIHFFACHGSVDWNCGGETYCPHRGTDFPDDLGTPVFAAASGILIGKVDSVTETCPGDPPCNGCDFLNGNFVRLHHGFDADGNEIRSVYLHLQYGSVTSKQPGDIVGCGEFIGAMGQTGCATGPHLHFEIQKNDTFGWIDPYSGPCNSELSWWVDQNGNSPLPNCSSAISFGGRVTLIASGTPLVGAVVTWGPYSTTTVAGGGFWFSDVPCETHPIVATHPDYGSSAPFDYSPPCDGDGSQGLECASGNCPPGAVAGAGAFMPGDLVEVVDTDGLGLRAWTGTCEGEYLVKLEGSRGMILAEQPECCGGHIRWKIRWEDDLSERWSAEGDPVTGEMWLHHAPPVTLIQVPGQVATIQAAIDLASNGSEVVVAPGTYFELLDFHGKAITVRSTEGAASTILDAGGNGSAVTFSNGETTATVLRGFTITGGNAPLGGGIYIENSDPTIKECILDGNIATGWGGGLYATGANPMISTCSFANNSASGGAGVFMVAGSGGLLSDCAFQSNIINSPGGFGGGVSVWDSSTRISRCTFNSNMVGGSGVGGGISVLNSNPIIEYCTFEGNTSSSNGGAVANGAGSSPTIATCTFLNNSSGGGGGAISNNSESAPSITACTFAGNSSLAGGAIINSLNCAPIIQDCEFNTNTATYGGGVANTTASSPYISNCHFVSNSATDSGGAIANDSSNPFVIGSTFENNNALFGAGIVNQASSPNVAQCSFQSNQALIGGGGIYSLANSNPAIGTTMFCANMPSDVFGPWQDLGGNQFLAHCTSNCSPADIVTSRTFQPPGDGIVDGADLAYLLGDWGQNPGSLADIVTSATFQPPPDGVVDGADLASLLGAWGACR